VHKFVNLYKIGGFASIFDILNQRFRSKSIIRRFRYPSDFRVGSGTTWLAGDYARIGTGFNAGRRCKIETIDDYLGVKYTPVLKIGNDVKLNDDIHIGCVYKVTIGNNVLMASKIYISDHNHGDYSGDVQDSPLIHPSIRKLSYSAVEIQDYVWIGEMVSILPGVTIGEGSIIGANSVVSRSIPPFSIAVGAPARVVKSYNHILGRWERV
jgi:acetyltransferase-like isoleucine patch superfamily enzyme